MILVLLGHIYDTKKQRVACYSKYSLFHDCAMTISSRVCGWIHSFILIGLFRRRRRDYHTKDGPVFAIPHHRCCYCCSSSSYLGHWNRTVSPSRA
jgi:hypothetical protein